MYLELSELLHKLFLFFAVCQRRKDVEENFQVIQVISRNTGQGEDRSDAANAHERNKMVSCNSGYDCH